MARTDNLTNFLTDVATAIKDKKGDITPIKASDFDTEITNLPSGGTELPTKGFIAEEYDADGYVTKGKVVGITSLPDGAFNNFNAGYGSYISHKLQEVEFPTDLTSIGQQAFRNCSNLRTVNIDNVTVFGSSAFSGCTSLLLTELPKNLTSIGSSCFDGDVNVKIKTIPDGVTSLASNRIFYGTGITQLSMNNVTTIGTDSEYAPFRYCANLKAFWIGSKILNLFRYSLATYSTNTQASPTKIFIDLPRAKVSTFSGYSYAFMNNASKKSIIICNDDAGFITKEEFDATTF